MIQTIFLQTNTIFKPLHKKEKVNLILSPSFYWVKVFTIPVDTPNKALFLLPNLFEDYFDIAGYSFYVIKISENQYLSFAYDEEKIIQKLKSLEIPQNKIVNIYFAQNEFQNLPTVAEHKVFGYGDEVFMFEKELLVKIPNNLVGEGKIPQLDLSKIVLGEHWVQLHSYKKFTSNKTVQFASGILLGFSILLFIQTFVFKQMTNEYPQKIEAIKQQYNLPPTLIQATAITNEYNKTIREYKRYRDAIGVVVSANTISNVTIETITLQNNKLLITYKTQKPKEIETYLKKEFRKVTSIVNDGNMDVRIEL